VWHATGAKFETSGGMKRDGLDKNWQSTPDEQTKIAG
jgi:hypothetical protein